VAKLIHADLAAAILAGAFHPAVLVEVDWPGDPVRAHNGVGPLTWDAKTWTGVGELGAISLPPATEGLGQETGQLVIGGTETQVAAIMAVDPRRVPVRAWFGAFTTAAGGALIGAPKLEWQGRISSARHEITTGDTITEDQVIFSLVSAVSQVASGAAQHSDADQRAIDATDTAGLILVAALDKARAQQGQT
jgi:hypothetical protein